MKIQSIVGSILLSLIFAIPLAAHAGDAEPQKLLDSRSDYSIEVKKALKPVNDRYLPKLEQLKKDLTLRGDLRGALTVEQQAEMMSTGQTSLTQQDGSAPPELSEITKNYSAEVQNALKSVRSLYLAKLEVLKQELALAGNLRDALAVEQEMDQIRSGHQQKQQGPFFVRAWNVDDLASLTINGQRILEVGYREDSGWVNIDAHLKPGLNRVEFQLDDFGGNWAYGFAIKQADEVLWEDKCGQCGWGKPAENEIRCQKPKDAGNSRYRAYYHKMELEVE